MKLIIQIPCRNEEQILPITLAALPKQVSGFDSVEVLIIDDGCTDRTVEVARENGVQHIVRFTRHQGLAAAFTAGLSAALAAGADVILNTDADNQYQADDIPLLVAPILAGTADIVIGERPISQIPHFSPIKKLLQRLGSWAVRMASNSDIPDAPSGFRAMSRSAAMQLHVFSEYTYTLETIIQAGQKRMAITSVPIRVNGELRPSRLVKSIPTYVRRSMVVIARIFITYKPFRTFATLGALMLTPGVLIGCRFLYFLVVDGGRGHLQSLLLAMTLLLVGSGLLVTGIMLDLISVNRKLLEKIDLRLQRLELGDTVRGTRVSSYGNKPSELQ